MFKLNKLFKKLVELGVSPYMVDDEIHVEGCNCNMTIKMEIGRFALDAWMQEKYLDEHGAAKRILHTDVVSRGDKKIIEFVSDMCF
ncbi:hypothetical protein Spock_281 [Bacillus phage Spock]|uniref:Uncharacterized protein n=1 Tax=Bacillus phage Spock TaxID=1406791 RepID=U5PX81_9CAUD|nr:hypothetical protein Spock_1 [Bacillus phage Spock]YP_008770505.1 hypothetical protein Spock_281 [Bacillus phage Spock]AGY48401.1 hypothetical protein Spock_1 [Bacillus phage Spock]AGY48681.1 hypothetical protein Spock_281 [Bacillus phage Spock]